MARLGADIKAHLEKATQAAVAAVEVYNRPGKQFRTAQYVIFIIIAWTALFHAVFFQRGQKPWCRKGGEGTGTRYVQIDGEPRYWDLATCLREYFGEKNPPNRANLEFLLGLRNRIEHRHLPELDPALYGECQASLMNLEEFLVEQFGAKWALAESLTVALQFSHAVPSARAKAIKRLGSSHSTGVLDYIATFRGRLPPETLASTEYSFSVYLIPKIANRASAADLSVEFVPFDPSKPEEAAHLNKVAALLKEKQVPVANLDLMKPTEVVTRVRARVPYSFTSDSHARAWRHFGVRPSSGAAHPARTKAKYCVYDKAHHDYLYTNEWVELLVKEIATADRHEQLLGRCPSSRDPDKR